MMRSSLLVCLLALTTLVAAASSVVPRRENALQTIEWTISSRSGEVGLHAYTVGTNGVARPKLYTFIPGTTVAQLTSSTLIRDLATSSSDCVLRNGEAMSHKAIPKNELLSDTLQSSVELQLMCTNPSSSSPQLWSFVQFTKQPRYPNLEFERSKSLRATSGDDSPYPMEASALMGNDWTGVYEWAKAFAENHLGELHPFLDYTQSVSQTGRWHLNTGEVLSDFTFGSESDSTVRLGVTADWGAGTMESDYVQQVMMTSNGTDWDPHWTLHIGDVYYVGTSDEVQSNCLGIAPDGVTQGVTWPHGSLGSFAVQGNHEMYSRGFGFFDTFLPTLGVNDDSGKAMGQEAGFLSLENAYWRIIMLDTGYNTYDIIPKDDNTNNTQPQSAIDWLVDVVGIGNASDTRGIIFMTHHQVRSAFEANWTATPSQISNLMPPGRTVLWLWGHEHRVSWYDLFTFDESYVDVSMYGRCIGNSGFPGEVGPIPADAGVEGLTAYDDRLYTYETGFSNAPVSYNGFVRLTLEQDVATLVYSSLDVDPDTGVLSPSIEVPLVTESFQMDPNTGNVNQIYWEVLNDEITVVQQG